ncbi:MAG: NMD3-related protein [Euryarchaeota archaeon]|nr:NMD3-related protein [Euryarchaeota archaeon]
MPKTPAHTPNPHPRTLFCPECGRETTEFYDNRCRDCFCKSVTLIECPPIIKIRICPVCGAYHIAGKWIEAPGMRDMFLSEISRVVKAHPDAKDLQLDFYEEELDPSRYLVHITASAVLSDLSISATADTEIRIKKETCDACSRIAGGYYAGIVQLRADHRHITEEEIERCIQLADHRLNKLTSKGDRFAFVSKIEELKEGVDLYIGSISACKQVGNAILKELGGTSAISSSLVGKKDGEDLYRVTCAVRLPEFVRGDVASMGGSVIEVTHQDRQIHGTDLSDGSKVSFDAAVPAARLGSRADAVTAVLVAIEKDMVQVLDPETYETVLLKKPTFLHAEAGSDVCVIKTAEGLFLLP